MVVIKYSAAVMKVCTVWQNNKKATVLLFKTSDFVIFCQKLIFSPQRWCFIILLVFSLKLNPLEPTNHRQ